VDKVQLRKLKFERTRKKAYPDPPIADALLAPERDGLATRVADRLEIARGTLSDRRKRHQGGNELAARIDASLERDNKQE